MNKPLLYLIIAGMVMGGKANAQAPVKFDTVKKKYYVEYPAYDTVKAYIIIAPKNREFPKQKFTVMAQFGYVVRSRYGYHKNIYLDAYKSRIKDFVLAISPIDDED